ncbi:hypothetical protein GCM10025866_13170 [Naasia aerilata]|uniref:Uncharacterized protein n=1 Tax=Naasia aerilata TaxID=1162966 RepID=A0ABM8GB34_9MICO|nr:hypothetical protein GCM10025866_13170 [Naasia aerilata]
MPAEEPAWNTFCGATGVQRRPCPFARATISQTTPATNARFHATLSVVASQSGMFHTFGGPCHHRPRVKGSSDTTRSAPIATAAGSRRPRTTSSAWMRPVASGRSAQATA